MRGGGLLRLEDYNPAFDEVFMGFRVVEDTTKFRCHYEATEGQRPVPQASVPFGARVGCAMEGRMLRIVVAATLERCHVDRHSCLLEPL